MKPLAVLALALLPQMGSAETLWRCDLQFYPAQEGEAPNGTLTVSNDGGAMSAIYKGGFSEPATFSCTSLPVDALECYGFFEGPRGTARQINIPDGAPAIGTPIIISALTLSFVEENLGPDGFDKTNLTDRRIAQTVMEISSCDQDLS